MMGDTAEARPFVSVLMLAYNHEAYIKKALDGVLMQKTDFTYEIVVGEDCSTDATRAILLEYAAARPGLFRLLLHERNVGMHENFSSVLRSARGEYIAFLECDDYWLDDRKLAMQVAFLENDRSFVGSAHRFVFVDENGKPAQGFRFKRFVGGSEYTLADAENGLLPSQNSSMVFRNLFAGCGPEAREAFFSCDCVGDAKLALFLVLQGRVHVFAEVMSAYRYVKGSGESWSAKTSGKNLSLTYLHWIGERRRLAKAVGGCDLEFRGLTLDVGYHAFVELLRRPGRNNFGIFITVFNDSDRKAALALHILKGSLEFPFRAAARIWKKALAS